MTDALLEAVLRRDRVVVIAALIALTVVAWAYVLWLAADMDMGGMDMEGFRMIPSGTGLMAPALAPWQPIEFVFVYVMWAVMMIGMMTPSVTPMLLLYARVGRQAATDGKPIVATGWFAGGYLISWMVFAFAATTTQWAIEQVALLSPMMESTSNLFGGALLILAGIYQWTPFKDVCLRQCQAPWLFIQNNGGFRRNASGAIRLGAKHGVYCIGCCWILMALLFVGGVMNVLWIALLTIFVLAEKVILAGRVISRIAGVLFVVPGVWLALKGIQIG